LANHALAEPRLMPFTGRQSGDSPAHFCCLARPASAVVEQAVAKLPTSIYGTSS
jgi:hypothetical protein